MHVRRALVTVSCFLAILFLAYWGYATYLSYTVKEPDMIRATWYEHLLAALLLIGTVTWLLRSIAWPLFVGWALLLGDLLVRTVAFSSNGTRALSAWGP
jgi:hypothetical protein